ncbi:PREDICTED: V-type proton ATPase 116 kDa subunit a-like [Nicrophorus vespilloides]|uniref:V-type proton ATPase subunit a n=1 Tax=Nicrophorus vespilloides TaxID=110193 RepID=A0ABM1N8T8_NICVS|nr:PREDICTED: V-type proton ATPase 116 kDa subunit a-like [Nicrophorus vespilloides]
MGSMFRSEEMVLAQIFIQPEAAYPLMSELGALGIVQFRDLNKDVNSFQRKFAAEVIRCDDMERKLRYVEDEMQKDKVDIPDLEEQPKAPNPREIVDLEAHLKKTEKEIVEMSESSVKLKSNFLELIELKYVLEKTAIFFNERKKSVAESPRNDLVSEDATNQEGRSQLSFVAGVIGRKRMPAFEKMLWRVCRGNVLIKQVDIDETFEDPITGNEIYKTVFVAFFQGDQLKERVTKVCSGFRATLHPCPSNSNECQDMLKEVKINIEDLTLIMNKTQDHRQRVLNAVAKDMKDWNVKVCKMKAIYHTMNYFNKDVSKKCLIAEGWIPLNDVPQVQTTLTTISSSCGSSTPSFMNVIDTNDNPPTFNRTNKFTKGFQNLIDSYGMASYGEVNPALYTIITFPFLFAVMFGDVGHAIIMLIFGAYMCIYEKSLEAKKIKSEIWTIFFGGRYIILLMGLFSIYTGFIYNDIFSLSMNIFGTSWVDAVDRISLEDINKNNFIEFNPSVDSATVPYPFGLDPIWQMGKNKIIFLNTFKMKLSIIFGVLHMIFGVSMSVINYVRFNKKYSIVLEFLPQIVFLVALFGWMVVLMIIKFVWYGAQGTDYRVGTSCAPSILIMFINMMLFKEPTQHDNCDLYIFEFQPTLQMILVVVGVLCIPTMLLGKPIYIIIQRRRQQKQIQIKDNVNKTMEMQPEIIKETDANKQESDGHGDDEPLSEVFIYQAIHTIEYVLSTISHTASYLRLWALSLAHSQLSEVLWSRIMRISSMNSFVGAPFVFLIFGAWAFLTIAILVMMEGLSAFLHTLRLHWVEFMSKFFIGLGYAFEPYSFKRILSEDE